MHFNLLWKLLWVCIIICIAAGIMYTYLNFRFISYSENEKYVVGTAAAIVKRFNRHTKFLVCQVTD